MIGKLASVDGIYNCSECRELTGYATSGQFVSLHLLDLLLYLGTQYEMNANRYAVYLRKFNSINCFGVSLSKKTLL